MKVLGEKTAIAHPADGLALFAEAGADAEPCRRVAVWHFSVGVVFDNEHVVVEEAPEGAREADLPHAPGALAEIVEFGDSLGGAVEFADFGDSESLAEAVPDFFAESVPVGDDAGVVSVVG